MSRDDRMRKEHVERYQSRSRDVVAEDLVVLLGLCSLAKIAKCGLSEPEVCELMKQSASSGETVSSKSGSTRL